MLLRRLPALARGWLKPPLDPLDTLVLPLRVWPTDLNLGGHMDNVRYLALMDMARSVFFARTGITRQMLKQKLAIPVAASHVRYRRELLPMDTFQLNTRILYWDDKWFFIEQHMVRDEAVVTEALFKSVFLAQRGHVEPLSLLQGLRAEPISPPRMPLAVHAWFDAEARQRGVEEPALKMSA